MLSVHRCPSDMLSKNFKRSRMTDLGENELSSKCLDDHLAFRRQMKNQRRSKRREQKWREWGEAGESSNSKAMQEQVIV